MRSMSGVDDWNTSVGGNIFYKNLDYRNMIRYQLQILARSYVAGISVCNHKSRDIKYFSDIKLILFFKLK